MNIVDFDYTNYDKERKIIIYGTEEYAVIVSYCLRQLSISYAGYADINKLLLPDVPIMGVNELLKAYQEENVIILLALSRYRYQEQIGEIESKVDTVYAVGSLLNAVYFFQSDYDKGIKDAYIRRYNEFIKQEKMIHPQGLYLTTLDAVVSEKCSLKCKNCSNLMQYYENPQNLSVNELKESIDKILGRVDRIGQLHILGGEPFMNCEFVKLIDAYFDEPKILEIAVFTNATIFPKEDVLEHLKHKKVHMRMSDYGELSRQLNAWVEWCETNKVVYSIEKMDKWHDCGKLEKHNYSEMELKEIYNTCECKNLPSVINNRLYNCPYAANAANLGAMDREDMEADSIVLTGELPSKKEIDFFLYERPYLEACRYCNGRNMSKAFIEPFVQTKNALPYEKHFEKCGDSVEKVSVKIESTDIQNDLISVVIPVYNVEPYVERCLRSVIRQTYKNIEIIVVDDGSTDDSATICKKFAQEDSRVIFISKEHSGVVQTRNKGIEAAKGEYMTFIDADDWIEDDYIEQMYERMDSCDIVVAGSIVTSVDLVDRYMRAGIKEGVYKDDKIKLIWKYMFRKTGFEVDSFILPHFWGKMYKSSMVKALCWQVDDRISMAEDYAFTHIYFLHCSCVKIIGIQGYHQCIRANESIDKRYNYSKIFSNLEIYYECLKKVFKRHSNAKKLLVMLDIEFADFVTSWIRPYYAKHAIENGAMAYYPYYGRLEGKRVILYGAGNIGKEYHRHLMDEECDLILWVDREAEKYREELLDVSEVHCIFEHEYDYIIIAVGVEETADIIKKDLVALGVPEEKLLWNKTKW